jgi:cell division septum initiation protein DivIVA
MTRDESLRRADELLTELIEGVETARAVPMSASCVLPREKVLDLLDELREVLPPEMDEARTVLATRDRLLKEAYEAAAASRARAVSEADTLIADAQHNAEQTLTAAREEAAEILKKARDEHAHLVAATNVHQAAAAAAAALRTDAEKYQTQVTAEAQDYDTRVRAGADRYAADARAEAERYATKLTTDAQDYADRTLDELAATLHKAATTAEQGRAALRQRRAGTWTSDNPHDGDEWASISA